MNGYILWGTWSGLTAILMYTILSYVFFILFIYCTYTATIIKFNQSAYSIDEDNGSVEPLLLLNIPAFTDFTVQVLSSDESASGKSIQE